MEAYVLTRMVLSVCLSVYLSGDNRLDKYKEHEQRWLRLIQNDIESIPISLVVIWAGALCGPQLLLHLIASWTYCLCRIGHTVAYANAMQPYRAIFWLVGVLSVLVIALNSLVGSLL